MRTADNAAVSIALPKIPDGEFSSVRLQGRISRRGLPSTLVGHRPSCPRLPSSSPRSVSGIDALTSPSVRAASAALPQGSSLRSGLCCPGPSSLNCPPAPHSRALPVFAALRLIRVVIAVRLYHGA